MDTPPADPISRYLEALERASKTEPFDATQAALATVDADGQPSVRFVLAKGANHEGFVFYTNYGSRKARALDANPRAALAWHWHTVGEQVRAEGVVQRLPAEAAGRYFATRPRGSQLGAWASRQSEVAPSREAIDRAVETARERFEGREVPLPPFWGGYVLAPNTIEFWKNGMDRLHDRWRYTRVEGAAWRVERLWP